MKIRTIIIDDEAPNRQNLTHLIGKYCLDVELIGEADSAASGIDIISQNNPDLVLLINRFVVRWVEFFQSSL